MLSLPQCPPRLLLPERGPAPRDPWGIQRGPRLPTPNIRATHPKPPPTAPTHSGHLRGAPATGTASVEALDTAPSRPQAGRRAFSPAPRRVPAPPRALQSRCPARPAASPPRPRGDLKPPRAQHTTGALPEGRWLGGEVRTAPDSAIFPGSGGPRAAPSVPLPAPQPPPRSTGTRGLHRRTAGAAAPHRTRAHPHAHASSSHSVRTQRARAKCAPVLTPRTRTACTCEGHTGPHRAHARGVYMQRTH